MLQLKTSKTRINIGVTFEQWCQLREQNELESVAMVAVFLMNRWGDFTLPHGKLCISL
uniref:Uncharacterized protein n=1 Tax=Monopterus albus TaxID=43700 RepID=A0A3Q3IL64_MONAL